MFLFPWLYKPEQATCLRSSAWCWFQNIIVLWFDSVIVTGKITAYAGQSKYQISVDHIEPAGSGAFMKILKERRTKLEQEGLFAKIP